MINLSASASEECQHQRPIFQRHIDSFRNEDVVCYDLDVAVASDIFNFLKQFKVIGPILPCLLQYQCPVTTLTPMNSYVGSDREKIDSFFTTLRRSLPGYTHVEPPYPQTHVIECGEPWFSWIRSGKKTVEGRLNIPKYKQIRALDILTFCSGKDSADHFTRFVTARNEYASFAEMIEAEGLDQILPEIDTIEKGVDVYMQFYNCKQEAKNGVVAFRLN